MGNILDRLADGARARVLRDLGRVSRGEMERLALGMGEGGGERFVSALSGEGIGFICEVKKASPSKGIIAEDFDYLRIAREYEAAGAEAISVLTEPEYFLGTDGYLSEIAAAVRTPVLRKDFVVDTYMVAQARALGASAVLLIAAILRGRGELAAFIAEAGRFGLAALVEVHDEEEARLALDAGARVVGVNNRDLRTFTVDVSLSERLRGLIPRDVLFVAESGISSAGDVRRLREIGADAALVGERLMRAGDKGAALAELRGR